MEKILSVFVDESGDFGKVNNASPYYIVTLVLHNQSEDLNVVCHAKRKKWETTG